MPEAVGGASRGRIRATLLGRFSIEEEGSNQVPNLSQDAARLLAFLLAHPARHERRDEVVRLLWGSGPGSPRESFDRARADAERILAPRLGGALFRDTGDGSIALDPASDIDFDLESFDRGVAAFEEAGEAPSSEAVARAVATERLYQGHLLESWDDAWLVPRREAVRERYLGHLHALLRHFESSGDHARAILYATRSLAVDPLRESAHRTLIGSLHALGDDAGAWRQYERMVETLRREGGREPEAETTALGDRVRRAAARARSAERDASD